MAKIYTARSYYRWEAAWQDPDPSKNRIYIDTYAYDYTSLTPIFGEQWYFQNRGGLWTHNNWNWTQRDFATIKLTDGIWGTAHSDSYNTLHGLYGREDQWMISLDYKNYKPVRQWRTTETGMIVVCDPGSATTSDQYGSWWVGRDMTRRSQAWCHNNTEYQVHCYEQIERINKNASSWTAATVNNTSGNITTITVVAADHGLSPGTAVTISGATAGTFPPNGVFVVTSATINSAFQFIVGAAPTAPFGGTLNFTATEYRSWGIEPENSGPRPSTGFRATVYTGYQGLIGNNDGITYQSKPFRSSLNWGRMNFFIGPNTATTHMWYLGMELEATEMINAYSVRYYDMRGRNLTETVALTNQRTAGQGFANQLPQLPSNLRRETASRYVVFSSHINTSTVFEPDRFVFDLTGTPGTVTKTDISISYPSGTTLATYWDGPSRQGGAVGPNIGAWYWVETGYVSWWVKPHQFVKGGTLYITMCVKDGYMWYSSTAGGYGRFDTLKRRTWVTYSATTGTNDYIWTFHSALVFPQVTDFPLGWVPYSSDESKMVIFSTNATTFYTFDTTQLTASSWSYEDLGGTFVAKFQFATAHGLVANQCVTTWGATASTNPPNGAYRIYDIPDPTSFRVIVRSENSGATITGTPGGTVSVRVGWEPGLSTPIRARGYAIDRFDRLWLTVRGGTGEWELHLLRDNIPAKVDIRLSTPVTGTTNKYIYTGIPIATTLLIDAYDNNGARLATVLTLTITGDSMTFTGGSKTLTITTNANAVTSAGVVINGAGTSAITATTII